MKTLIDLQVGDTLEQPQWLVVTQSMIDQFAEATGDHQWIHLDKEKCKRESPFSTTIAHGFLTASLMPKAFSEVLEESDKIASTINYGIDNLRFLEPVKCEDSVKYQFKLVETRVKPAGTLYKVEASCVLKSSGKPALVGTFLMLGVLKP
ncbi:MaoC family dehydratase [Alteromonas sp. 345S023]|uniref:MaoC family dehydratase n=1 Tax=Alteromonas profundi TaxID=2696062 RepID=A0A7X5LJV1_9ALTE|nr:MaoC/PaaZ C-terminal domain-containing protein [Alteromonas profundi]NDV90695.1 MaoC family dehydratase [Alteromonas profundi]